MTSIFSNLGNSATAYGGRNPSVTLVNGGNPKLVSNQPLSDPKRYADILTLSANSAPATLKMTLAEMKAVRPTAEVRSWALGLSDELAEGGGWAGLTRSTRSNKLLVQAQSELSEKTVGTQIAALLKQAGITLGDKDRLDFAVNEKGDITVKSGITDAKQKLALENVLNSNAELKSNLLRYEAQKQFAQLSTMVRLNNNVSGGYMEAVINTDGSASLKNPDEGQTTTLSLKVDQLMYNADAIAKGMKTVAEMTNVVGSNTDLSFTFSYQKGQVFQGESLPEERVFSNRSDSLGNLAKIIGLDEDAGTSVQSFIAALEDDISKQNGTLQDMLNAAIKKAGLGDVKKKITFAADENGKIIVEGNIRKDQKAKLERGVNGDGDIADLLKNQRAKKDVLAELQASVADTFEAAGITDILDEKAILAYSERPTGFDLTSDTLAFARNQLLTDYMNRSGVSVTELKADTDSVFARNGSFSEVAGLRNEVEHFVTEKAGTPTGTTTLFAMKRGELVAAGEAPDFTKNIAGLKKYVREELLDKYNEMLGSVPGMRITNYTITMDDRGAAVIEVQTEDGDRKSMAQANKIINSWFNSSNAAELGKDILAAHDDEHGDVQEYRHRVVIDSSAGGYRVESPEADKAALAETASLAGELGSMFGDFFQNTLGIKDAFSLQLSDGKITLNTSTLNTSGGLQPAVLKQINDVLNALNERLLSDDPLNEKSFDSFLPTGLSGAVEKVLALQEAQSKLHSPELKESGLSRRQALFTLSLSHSRVT